MEVTGNKHNNIKNKSGSVRFLRFLTSKYVVSLGLLRGQVSMQLLQPYILVIGGIGAHNMISFG